MSSTRRGFLKGIGLASAAVVAAPALVALPAAVSKPALTTDNFSTGPAVLKLGTYANPMRVTFPRTTTPIFPRF